MAQTNSSDSGGSSSLINKLKGLATSKEGLMLIGALLFAGGLIWMVVF